MGISVSSSVSLSALQSLFSSSSTSGGNLESSTGNLEAVLDAAYGVSTTTSSTSSTSTSDSSSSSVQYAPTPPWEESSQPSPSKLVKNALSGASFFNPSAAKLDLTTGASAAENSDYKNLFALYSGLNTLYSIADEASGNISSAQLSQLENAFSNGMSQLQKFLSTTSFSKLDITEGTLQQSQISSATTPAQAYAYTTQALNTTGNSDAVVPAFEGNVSFDVNVQLSGNATTTVPINLAGMGSTPRTIGNVVTYMNNQLSAAGVYVNFSAEQIAAQPDTITVGNQTVTVSSGNMSWALQVNTNPAETVTLSAPQTGAEVYVGQIVGDQTSSIGPTGATVAADAQSQLLTFNASGDGVTGPSTPAFAASTQLTTTSLGSSVNSVQATAVAPDGSVYVLANVNATTTGGATPGGQDVALMEYDSAGNLLFSTDLGSASSASGLSLAVSPDGSQVAVVGTVNGSLSGNQTVNQSTGPDGFVAVYDSQGDLQWEQQDDGLTPNQANAVAFGANGTVYVTGQSQTTTGVADPTAPSDSYLQAFNSSGVQVSNTQIATGGTNTGDAVAVDGNDVYVAGVQNGDAVVSEYDMTNPSSPTLVASRNLGSLGGGAIVGLAVQDGTVYVGGTTTNGDLDAGAVTSADSGGGLNSFAATLSTGLAPAASDAIAYYGGSGSTAATAMTVANGDVYLTGTVSGSLPNEPAIGNQDGFIAALNVAAGTVDYAQRFTGQDGQVDPTSIAVASNGESVLDQFGLPEGVVDGPVSNLITSATSVKAGDSFGISVNGGAPITITIQADDTMASLSSEIAAATGSSVKVSVAPGPNGSNALEVQPGYPGATVRLIDGPSGSDALEGLGLKPGVVADTKTSGTVTKLAGSGTPIYGLGIPGNLDLSSAADIKTAKVQLAGAISVVEQAYQNLANAATPASVLALQKAQSSGSAPKYLTDQIANYQAALERLTAGSSSSSSGVSSLL